jgi:anti-sigma factor RsiW
MAHSDELIRRYLDGELARDDSMRLREHLAGCGRCRHQLAALERLDARLRDLDRLASTRDFAALVRARATALPPRRAPRWHWPLSAALAVLGVLALLIAGDQFLALAGGMVAAAGSLAAWALDIASGGVGLAPESLGLLGAGTEPALVAGLCLLGLAGLLVLRRSLESPLEA